MSRLRSFLQRIERGFLEAWSCVIDAEAERAVPAMFGHRQMNGRNLVGDVLAGQETEEFAVFHATVGVNQVAAESIETRTGEGIHDVSPSIR
jgi:hypothetical protein